MDLSNPLATVTPTLDAAVLLALSATTGMSTGGQVHRMARAGSADGVRKVLARLVRQGIVDAEDHPHATLYRLNRDHVAAGPILELTRLRARIVENISKEIQAWSVAPIHASLFGSFARGQADDDSDIDILIVADHVTDEDAWQGQIDTLARNVRRWTGNDAHIVAITLDRLTAMLEPEDPLVESWRSECVPLTGLRILDLLRQARVSGDLPLKGLS